MCNFLGICAEDSTRIVRTDYMLPRVNIAGSDTRYINRKDSLVLNAFGQSVNCTGNSTNRVFYSWSVYQDEIFQPDMQSVSAQTSVFRLPTEQVIQQNGLHM
jgi:hypothetical protein